MRILIITLLMVSSAFAGPFEDNYDKSAGEGSNPYQYYEDIRNNDGNYNDLMNNYYNAPLGSLDTSDVPKDAVENDPAQSVRGYSTGAQLSGKVSKENSLLSILRGVQSGSELTTLGDTYVCNYDNVTYDDYGDCQKSCQTVCGEYKFNVQFGCQYPEEVVRVSVPDSQKLSAAPVFNLSLKKGLGRFTTPPATAICVNGMKSGNKYYTWNIEGNVISVLTPHSPADVGECYDMTKKPFFVHYQDYYRYMGYSIQAYLSKLGYVASHTIESSSDLVFSAIVAGACAEGVAMTGIPNAAEVEMVRQGNMPPNIRDIADKNDMYKMVTENTDYSAYTCSVTNSPKLYTDTKRETMKYEPVTFCADHVAMIKIEAKNNEAFVYVSNMDMKNCPVDPRYPLYPGNWYLVNNPKLPNEILKATLNFTAYGAGCDMSSGSINTHSMNSIMATQCSEKNKQYPTIDYSIDYEYPFDLFSVVKSDTCSVPEDCKLESEYVCDMNGNNCVQTVKQGNRKGESVPKMCSEISTTNDKYLVCSDGKTISATGGKNTFKEAAGYFTTKKQYKCSTPKEEKDYSAFLEQSKLISESATMAPNGDYTFTSIGLDGKQEDFTTNVTLKDTQCIQTCKVKVPTNQDNKTVVLHDGKTGTPPPVLNTPYYKPCVYEAEDDEWECVLEGNEKLVAGGGCGCPNDFVDVIVNLKFVDEAASGMVCSDKGKKP